jgi:hypothetical protein
MMEFDLFSNTQYREEPTRAPYNWVSGISYRSSSLEWECEILTRNISPTSLGASSFLLLVIVCGYNTFTVSRACSTLAVYMRCAAA